MKELPAVHDGNVSLSCSVLDYNLAFVVVSLGLIHTPVQYCQRFGVCPWFIEIIAMQVKMWDAMLSIHRKDINVEIQ